LLPNGLLESLKLSSQFQPSRLGCLAAFVQYVPKALLDQAPRLFPRAGCKQQHQARTNHRAHQQPSDHPQYLAHHFTSLN
jgi:hypothetical protein